MISTKINVSKLFYQHLLSLRSQGNVHLSYIDVVTFYGIPFLFSVAFWIFVGSLKAEAVAQIDSILVDAFSIFAALLLNAQVLIIGLNQRSAQTDKNEMTEMSREDIALRDRIKSSATSEISELFANISYSILIALSLVAFTLIAIFSGISNSVIVKSIQFFGVIHFCLTGLMVLKRMHVVFRQT